MLCALLWQLVFSPATQVGGCTQQALNDAVDLAQAQGVNPADLTEDEMAASIEIVLRGRPCLKSLPPDTREGTTRKLLFFGFVLTSALSRLKESRGEQDPRARFVGELCAEYRGMVPKPTVAYFATCCEWLRRSGVSVRSGVGP